MAKRFTDNEKWKDAWFMDLPSKYKLFWLYLLDECNHAGIWKVNFKVASFYIGEHLEYSEVKRILKDRITLLDDEYWYIDKFIKYQYKTDIQGLNPKNKAHLSVIKLLHNYTAFKPLTSPLLGVKDKDKDIIYINTDLEKIEIWINDLPNHQIWMEGVYRTHKLRSKVLVNIANEFKEHLKIYPTKHKNINDFKKHLSSWIGLKIRNGEFKNYLKQTRGSL